MSKKLSVKFVTNNEINDIAADNALLTQLMVTITQIGIRVDNPENNNDIIEKEKEDGKKILKTTVVEKS